MNIIEFRVVPTDLYYGPGIQIWIDGQDFIEVVRRVELPFAQAEHHRGLAGSYAGLPACAYSPPSRHFWGEGKASFADRKLKLLVCGDCGEFGCWPLLARIEVGPTQVVWSAFEQPHRRRQGQLRAWCYDSLGPLMFDRSQYEQALQTLEGATQ